MSGVSSESVRLQLDFWCFVNCISCFKIFSVYIKMLGLRSRSSQLSVQLSRDACCPVSVSPDPSRDGVCLDTTFHRVCSSSLDRFTVRFHLLPPPIISYVVKLLPHFPCQNSPFLSIPFVNAKNHHYQTYCTFILLTDIFVFELPLVYWSMGRMEDFVLPTAEFPSARINAAT